MTHITLSYRITALLAVLMTAVAVWAQDAPSSPTHKGSRRKVMIHGTVADSFTKAALKAHMTLMNADSTVVDTTTCWKWELSSGYGFTVEAYERDLIIRATLDGYEPAYVNFRMRHIGRNTEFEMPMCLMKRKTDDGIYKTMDLGGVTVVGTKVKIAYRGDTVVYNASAFNLPEGSMLDDLVKQLPGAQIKSNGDIFVNGKKVDCLLLNGSDFFKGNNKVMLDNLPYYTVKDLKVYHRSSERSRWAEEEKDRKEYVMDVNLKREYSRGYVASAEAGGGSHDRWLARLFALAYSDHTRLSVFANANNVGDNESPGDNGDWATAYSPVGDNTTRTIGLNLNAEDKDKRMTETLSADIKWNHSDNESRTTSETFASSGNIYGRSLSQSSMRSFAFNATNSLIVNKPFKLMSYITAAYTNNTSRFSMSDVTFSSDPSGYGDFMQVLDSAFAANASGRLLGTVTNRSRNVSFSRRHALQLSGSANFMQKLPWGDKLFLTLGGTYNDTRPADRFAHNHAEYVRAGSSDFRNLYSDTHSSDYTFSTRASYSATLLSGWTFESAVGYNQNAAFTNDLSYRLERLAAEWASPQAALGTLPSSRDSLQMAFDMSNSTWYNDMRRCVHGGLTINKYTDKLFVNINLPLSYTSERMDYHNAATDTIAHRRYGMFYPDAFIMLRTDRSSYYMSYRMNKQITDMATLMPSYNDTNPLSRRINNPNLKSPIMHSLTASMSFDKRDRHKQSFGASASYSNTRHAYATRTRYDTATGAYTSMRDNIDGNWDVSASFYYSCMPDSANRLTFSSGTTLSYNRSVDYDMAYDDADFVKSRVGNANLSENMTASYTLGEFTVGAGAWVSWRVSNSDRANFSTINAVDLSYGLNATCKLPLGLKASTDIKMYSRRGYQEHAMNTDDLVWNASLSRSFLKSRLTLKIDAYDLLRQLSSTSYSVNAQGRTETWQRSLSAYVMARVAYKFDLMPNGK